MKTAVYRTSDDSALVSALIDCAEQGKQAVCLVELKARFDERRNIEWSRELEQAGVHVVHGFPDMKIHAKMTLVVRREAGGLRRYVHIGTGNYHASTARLYEDVGIFTADEEIAADVADVFNYVTGFGRPQRFRKLLVAPFEMRKRLVEEIRRRRRSGRGRRDGPDPAQAQQPRRPDADRRALRRRRRRSADRHLRPVDLHAAAGRRGAVRERSACGRSSGGSSSTAASTRSRRATASTVLIGSADLMPRNLDRRVEVLDSDRERARPAGAPGDPRTASSPTTSTRGPSPSDGSWAPVEPKKPEKAVDHQVGDDAARAAARPPADDLRASARTALAASRPSGDAGRMRGRMRVAVIDVGSNTARLLVANVTDDGRVVPLAEERSYLRLGAEIERTGTLGRKKIAALRETCRRFRSPRDALGVDALDA